MAGTLVSSFGKISINGKPYTIVPEPNSYDVKEAPAHGDVDPKMERRVIYRTFSAGIGKRREEPSIDATSSSNPSFSFNKQIKQGTGFFWANGCDTRSQDRIFVQRQNTVSTLTDSSEQPFLIGDATSFSWAVSSHAVWAMTSAPNTWTRGATIVPTVTDAVQFGGYVYIAVGNSNSFYTWDQTSSTGVFTQQSNAANNFTVIRNQLWRSQGANVYSTLNTNPASQVWTSATVIGDPNTNITALDVWQDFLMIFKPDGIYNVDKTGAVYPLFPGFKNLGTNPRPIGQWRESYYFAADVGLVWEIGKGQVRRIGFDLSEPYPMAGNVFSIPNASTRGIDTTNFLLVGFNEYAATSTSAAYFLAWDGNAWHPVAYFPASSADGLGMTGGNLTPITPTLQFSVGSRSGGSNAIYYQTQPLVDPFLAGGFDTSAQVMYLSADNGALEDESKVLERVNVWLDNPAAGTIRIAYALDENIANLSFRDMGPPSGDRVSSAQQFLPPQPLPSYRKIQLRITIQATSSSASPVGRYIILHYKQRMPQRKVWTLGVLADKNIISGQGRVDVRDAKKILNDLNVIRNIHQQVQFIDIMGTAYQVYIDEVGEKIQVLRGATDPSFIASLTLVEAASEQIFQ